MEVRYRAKSKVIDILILRKRCNKSQRYSGDLPFYQLHLETFHRPATSLLLRILLEPEPKLYMT